MKKRNLLYILPLVFAVGCEPEFDDVNLTRSSGTADFSRTVAVGNSLTAGYQSNALSLEGQENSLPEILAKQFALAGGGTFKTPFLTGEAATRGAGVSAFGQGVLTPSLSLQLKTDCLGETSPSPSLNGSPYPIGDNFASIASQGPFNNVGVPGAKLTHINFSGYAGLNPYFSRFASSTDQTMVEHAMSINPTFFTLWIGNNDVLGYSTGGGEESPDDITDQNTFAFLYAGTIDSLTKNGAKGAVANIPNITSIPFFNTVPANALPLTQEQANQANNNPQYAGYNQALQFYASTNVITAEEAAQRTINFKAGPNYLLIEDDELTQLQNPQNPTQPLPNYRQMVEGELLTLTTPLDSIKCAGFGILKPMPGQFVLRQSEIDKINDAVAGYNTTIKNIATANGLAHVDANQRLKDLQSGITYNGISYTTTFVTGGAFSLDGVHPNSRGYAIIANTFIDAINSTYGSSIDKVNVNAYPTIE